MAGKTRTLGLIAQAWTTTMGAVDVQRCYHGAGIWKGSFLLTRTEMEGK